MKSLVDVIATVVCLVGSVFAAGSLAAQEAHSADRVPLKGTVIVVNQKSDSVTLIDLARMEAYRHVPVVNGPHEVAVSPDGWLAMITNYHGSKGPQNTLSLISLPDGETVRTIGLGAFSMPHDILWVNANQVVCTVEANRALLLINAGTGEVERVFETGHDGSHMLALSKDRRRLYSSNMSDGGSVSVFDFQSGTKIADIATGAECEGVGVSPDNLWVWAGNRAAGTISIIDARSLKVAKTLDSPGFPYRIEFTPDGKYALVPHARSGTLVVGEVGGMRIARQIVLEKTGVESPSPAGVIAHPDNVHVFVTVRNDNSMLVVNLENGETEARVAVQSSPDGVAYSPLQR